MARTSAKLRFAVLYARGFLLLIASGSALIIFGALIFTNLSAFDVASGVFSLLVISLLTLLCLAAILLITEAPTDKVWPPSILKQR